MATITFGIMSIGTTLFAVWGWIDSILGGFGDRHGVGSEGQFLLMVLFTVLALGLSFPFILLLRTRRIVKGSDELQRNRTTEQP